MRIGILTGSGTYALPGIESDGEPELVETRFGAAPVTTGRFAGVDVLHVSRHRPGHELLSSQVTHQANIAALKERGADAILSVTVCGTLDASMSLGSLVVFDDLHFLTNRLPNGEICTLFTEPGEKGRGHWIYERPFSQHLRASGKPPKVARCAAARKLLHQAWALGSKLQRFDPDHKQQQHEPIPQLAA